MLTPLQAAWVGKIVADWLTNGVSIYSASIQRSSCEFPILQ